MPPPQPPPALRALLGEYGVDTEWVTLYEAHGVLHADGRGLYQVPLRCQQPLLYMIDASAACERTRFEFHVNATGDCHAVSIDGKKWPRRGVGAEVINALRSGLGVSADNVFAAALGASPPVEIPPKNAGDLVSLTNIHPSIRFDIRYASTNNLMGFALYDQALAFLQRPAAVALGRVAECLQSMGYGLLVFDAYRPWFITKVLWDATPPGSRRFVADPAVGSRHNRGCAVDLSLYDIASGHPEEMTSPYDDMSRRAHVEYVGGTSRQRWARDLLRRAMAQHGFTAYAEEWWHFDYEGWRDYGIGNLTLSEVQQPAGDDVHMSRGCASR